MYIVYLKPVYTREREYTLTLTLTLASHFCHIVTPCLKTGTILSFCLVFHTTIPIVVYKNLRKVL